MRHPAWAPLFDLAAGRGADTDRTHAEGCPRCARSLALARLLLGLGRSVRAVPAPGAAARRLAEARIGSRRRAAEPSPAPLLALVFDSFARAAPAVRSAGAAAERYLRWEGGGVALDLRVRRAAGGRTLHGAVEPPDAAGRAAAVFGEDRREAAIGPDGEFVLRRLPTGPVRIELGGHVTEPLDL